MLLASGEHPIVEDSRRDIFWGAKTVRGDATALAGHNVLGRLLVGLREMVRQRQEEELLTVTPPPLEGFLLFGMPIGRVVGKRA